MITELRWVEGTFGNMFLEACDGTYWFPIPIAYGLWQGEIPGFKRDSVSTVAIHNKFAHGIEKESE